MKRSSDTQQSNQAQGADSNKKMRYNQPNYGDSYAQYGMMPQYSTATSFAQGASANNAYAAYTQPSVAPMYGMNYGVHPMMASQYGAAAAAAAAGYPQSYANTMATATYPSTQGMPEASRTIYLGNVPKNLDAQEILKKVNTGLVESFRTVPEKNCAFLAFVDPNSAFAFYQEYAGGRKLIVQDTEVRVGWGKANTIPNNIKMLIQNGATRNVYLNNLDDSNTEESIRSKLIQFGPIEQVRLVREKNIAFVHFLSINDAHKCVSQLPNDPEWAHRRINYGKDHCANRTDNSQYGSFGFQNAYAAGNGFGFDAYGMGGGGAYAMQQGAALSSGASVSRTLYLSKIHPEATCEDLCNAIRGGNLLQIRYFPEKHYAFVTFIEPSNAVNVMNYANDSNSGLHVKGRKLHVGWGKPSSISSDVFQAIQSGATRNIYIGGIDDSVTEDKLKQDFSEYGEIELINTYRDKKCAFVNFTTIENATKALRSIKEKPGYEGLKINYGKDRCGNPFKPMAHKNNNNKNKSDNSSTLDNNSKQPGTENEEVNVKFEKVDVKPKPLV